LCAGQKLDLGDCFCFKPCTGRVQVRVVEGECGEAVGGARVQLLHKDGKPAADPLPVGASGEVCFDPVPPGKYLVRLEQEKFVFQGRKWALSKRGEQYEVHVTTAAATPTLEFRVQRDLPRILIEVSDPGGDRHRRAQVDIFDQAKNLVDSV